MEQAHELVDLRPPPVVPRQRAAHRPVALPTALVQRIKRGLRDILFGIGIKIIVDVNAIDIVTAQHVEHDVERVPLHAGIGRILPEVLAVAPHPFGTRHADMIGRGGGFRARDPRAKRIEPGVQLQSAPVGLRHGEGQRIVEGRGSRAHRAGEILGPRFEVRRVQGVARRAHLQNDRVEPEPGGVIEDFEKLGLLLGHGQSGPGGPVDVGFGGNPNAAKFTGHGRRSVVGGGWGGCFTDG